jgi:spoIIIJ-associated protein
MRKNKTMPNQNESLDVSAKSIEDAIEQGLAELGVTRDQVSIEILNEGKRGIFGLGSEEAVVRLTVRGEPAPQPAVESASVPVSSSDEVQPAEPEETDGEDNDAPIEQVVEEPVADEAIQNPIELARGHLEQLLDLMGVEATVVSRTAPDLVDNEGEPPPTVLDITGSDLGILIGRRSETLQALQYMVRLMVSKDIGGWHRTIVDVESYRSRRHQSLQKMAERMAERATTNGERVVLEAMTPYERRIIHITLRDHPKVYTKSIGRENNRKVSIIPK